MVKGAGASADSRIPRFPRLLGLEGVRDRGIGRPSPLLTPPGAVSAAGATGRFPLHRVRFPLRRVRHSGSTGAGPCRPLLASAASGPRATTTRLTPLPRAVCYATGRPARPSGGTGAMNVLYCPNCASEALTRLAEGSRIDGKRG